MAAHKGHKKLGGRKKGTKNKRTQEVERIVKEAIEKGLMPLEYMIQVMVDKRAKVARRDDMAKAAAPYLHARRAPEDKAGKTVPPMIYLTPVLEDDPGPDKPDNK